MFHLVFMLNRYRKCYKNFFGQIILGAHTVQNVPKYIWMWHCLVFTDIFKAESSSLERICCGFLLYCLNEDNAVYLVFVFLIKQNL